MSYNENALFLWFTSMLLVTSSHLFGSKQERVIASSFALIFIGLSIADLFFGKGSLGFLIVAYAVAIIVVAWVAISLYLKMRNDRALLLIALFCLVSMRVLDAPYFLFGAVIVPWLALILNTER